MPEAKIPGVQTNKEALSVSSISPILSSAVAGWENILVEYWQLPAYELPTQPPLDYVIYLHFQRPAQVEMVRDGRLISKRFTYGDIAISPPDLPCRGVCLEASDFLLLRLQPALVTRTAQELGSREKTEITPCLGVVDPQIQHIGLALKTELESGCLSGRLYSESLATALASYLLQRYSTSSQPIQDVTGGLPKHKLWSVLEYINDNLENDLKLAELASMVQMSTYHFARLFKQSTGLAPYQYVINCRIERAKILLAERKLSIIEICDEVGFRNPSHFTALFRKFTTITPKAYRDQI